MATIDTQVGAGADDAHEYGLGAFSFDSDEIRVRRYSPNTSNLYRCGGFCFTPNVPQGATIDVAYMSVQARYDLATYGDIFCTIYCHDTDDADDFEINQNIISIANRPRTSASVAWQEEDGLTFGSFGNTPSLVGPVQEVVNRASWSASNGMAFLWIADVGTNKLGYMYSYEGDTTKAAKLHIEYTPSGPTPGYYQLQYTSEPPTPNAWNQLKQDAGAGWKKLLFEGE